MIDRSYSISTQLESKSQLKAHRWHKWKMLLVVDELNLDLYPWWTEDERSRELKIWKEADEDYEERKEDLLERLQELDPAQLSTYFQEIGIKEQNIGSWLKPSPFDV